jgi:hypothetical protein
MSNESEKILEQLFGDVESAVAKLSPEQRAIMDTLKQLIAEAENFSMQLRVLKKDYDDLYRVFIVILSKLKEQGVDEYRIHKSQFKRFNTMYRIDRDYDPETGEVIFRLLTLDGPLVIDLSGGH